MTQATAPRRICVIFNPTARGEGAKRALRDIELMTRMCAFKPTFAANTARPLAAEAVREGFDTIVAMGGDGTVNEVLNGMAEQEDALARVRLAILPVGTVNVFARELGIPGRFKRAWEVICAGRERLIDLPSLSFETPEGPRRRWFAQMAGCGLDARAVELMSWKLKKRIGQFAYVVAGFQALREKPAMVRVQAGAHTCEGQLVLIGNGRLYGGPLPVFRQADLRDGLLDFCVFPRVNWFVICRYACAYVARRMLHRGPELHFQAASARMESSLPVPIELDGEHVGRLPAECSIQSRVLRVIVP